MKKYIYQKYSLKLNHFYYLEFTSCSPINYENLIIKFIFSPYNIDLKIVEIIALFIFHNYLTNLNKNIDFILAGYEILIEILRFVVFKIVLIYSIIIQVITSLFIKDIKPKELYLY